MKSNIEFARAVPDDSEILKDCPEGMCQSIDGIMYVPQSRWRELIAKIAELKGFPDLAKEIMGGAK